MVQYASMATPFDATTKTLVDLGPEDWLRFLALPFTGCRVIDSDLATVSTEADRLIEAQAETPYVAHLEFQTGHEGGAVPERLLRYNGIAVLKTGRFVLSFAVLLRPEADSPRLTGTLELTRPDASVYLRFEYSVLRLWQVPAAQLLGGGLATAPLALLADLTGTTAGTTAGAVVTALEARIQAEASPGRQEELWAIAYLLSGVRFTPLESQTLLGKAVAQMRESSTYQEILAEGRAEGRRQGEIDALFRVGVRRLGEPDAVIQEIIDRASLERLQAWLDRVTDVESWQELLAR